MFLAHFVNTPLYMQNHISSTNSMVAKCSVPSLHISYGTHNYLTFFKKNEKLIFVIWHRTISGGYRGYATSETENETVIKKSSSHTNFST